MYEYQASLSRVVDGDTMDLTLDLGFHLYHSIRVRLASVDAPEAGTPEGDECTEAVKKWFSDRVGPFTVITKKDRQEKYGRYLAEVLYNSESLNILLLDMGYKYGR